MLYVGILSLGYYLVLRIYTGRKDSTFLPFWLIFGICTLGAGLLEPFWPDWLRDYLWIPASLFLIVFAVVELSIARAMLEKPERGLDYIIVLGAQVRGERVSKSLRRRLDRAAAYLRENPDTKAILSGGQGRGEAVSEAEAMYRYLCEKGMPEERLIQENSSKSTWENLQNSRNFIERPERPVGIVTNNFHVRRSLMIAKRVGYGRPEGIPASSSKILLPNYLVREFFACVKFWIKNGMVCFEKKNFKTK
jgi:uncharacterized SAM-binding protein YcdF (DUF218 family)